MAGYRRKNGDPATVLVLGETTNLADLYAEWLPSEYRVLAADDCSTALALLDGDFDVAVVDRRSPNGTGDKVLTTICERELESLVAVITTDPPEIGIFDMEFDDYLCAPVTRREVQTTVRSLLAQQEYGDAIKKLYRLVSKKAALETEYPAPELESCQRYKALVERIETLNEEISAMTDTFTASQFSSDTLWRSNATDD